MNKLVLDVAVLTEPNDIDAVMVLDKQARELALDIIAKEFA